MTRTKKGIAGAKRAGAMRTKKGIAGMFIILVMLMGFIAWVYQSNVRSSEQVVRESLVREARSNHLAIVKNVILRTYPSVNPENRLTWAGAIAKDVAEKYGVNVAFDFNSFPGRVTLEDGTYGLTAQFELIK